MRSPGEGGDPGGVPELPDDDTIRRRLRSDHDDEVQLGIEDLDRRYRCEICRWARMKYPVLPSVDLPVIWNEVLMAVYDMAKSGEIEAQGELSELLHLLADRKAIDCLRRMKGPRRRIDRGADVNKLAIDCDKDPNERFERIEAIRAGIKECLKDNKQQLFLVRLDFFVEKGRPPSLAELTEEFNKVTNRSATKKSVKGLLQRGNSTLRAHLKSKGLWP